MEKVPKYFEGIVNEFVREYDRFCKRADRLYNNYCTRLAHFHRICDLNTQISGREFVNVAHWGYSTPCLMSDLERKQSSLYWSAAEDYVYYTVLNYPIDYMAKTNLLRVPPYMITTIFLPKIHVNLDRFFHVVQRRSADPHYDIQLGANLFVYNHARRARVINRMRDIMFRFHSRFALRPRSPRRNWLPAIDMFAVSNVGGELVYSRKTYLDALDAILRTMRPLLHETLIQIVHTFLFGQRRPCANSKPRTIVRRSERVVIDLTA